MLLALDTATRHASIALYDGETVLAELNWRTARRHTVELAPQVAAICQLAGVTIDAITALGVCIGPGSYTGARIALSYAKGMVAARDLPLIGVSGLDAMAYPHLGDDAPVCAMVAMGRGRYAWALYDAGDVKAGPRLPRRLSDYRVDALEDLLARLTPPVRLVGELDAQARQTIRSRWDASAMPLISPALGLRRGGALAELAWLRLQAGDVDDPVSLSPIYVK